MHNTDEAAKFVQDRVDEGVDYVKIIADAPGHDQAVLDRIQVEARKHGKMTVAHTAQYEAFGRGLHAGFDILTHVPMDNVLDDDVVGKMVRQKTVAVPTCTSILRLFFLPFRPIILYQAYPKATTPGTRLNGFINLVLRYDY